MHLRLELREPGRHAYELEELLVSQLDSSHFEVPVGDGDFELVDVQGPGFTLELLLKTCLVVRSSGQMSLTM
jgi:hypothetical protein